MSKTKKIKLNGNSTKKKNETTTSKEKQIYPKQIEKYKPFYQDNFVNYLKSREKGILPFKCGFQSVGKILKSYFSTLGMTMSDVSFQRVVTALVWHPSPYNKLAVASKFGDIVLLKCSINTTSVNEIETGSGPGNSIQAMVFSPRKDSHLYTVSVNGLCMCKDIETSATRCVLNTMKPVKDWFTAIDAVDDKIVVGDNRGNLTLLTHDGQLVWEKRISSQKINFCDMNNSSPWLLATSSEHAVKIWDLRKMNQKYDFISNHPHNSGVSSCYFSPSHGCKLLTTDQGTEIRVYSGPLWQLSTVIPHPHRMFQYITPIKAAWSPFNDIIVIGRYPDPSFPNYSETEFRSIDFFDSETGEYLHKIQTMEKNNIVSLNQFNHSGDILASSLSRAVVLWTPNIEAGRKLKPTDHSNTLRPGGGNDDDDDDDDDNNNHKKHKLGIKKLKKMKTKRKPC